MPPRKKSHPTTEIIRAVTGFSVDPIAEKAIALLIRKYRKNRVGGQNKSDALKQAGLELVSALTGIRIPRATPRHVQASHPRTARKPVTPHEDSDDEIIRRLKAELDRRNAERSKS